MRGWVVCDRSNTSTCQQANLMLFKPRCREKKHKEKKHKEHKQQPDSDKKRDKKDKQKQQVPAGTPAAAAAAPGSSVPSPALPFDGLSLQQLQFSCPLDFAAAKANDDEEVWVLRLPAGVSDSNLKFECLEIEFVHRHFRNSCRQ
jgi:hypothetical protein